MKRVFFLLATLCLAAPASAGVFVDEVIANGIGEDFTVNDNSREVWVDVNNDGFVNDGDQLYGYLRIDTPDPLQNNVYAVFSQVIQVPSPDGFAGDLLSTNGGLNTLTGADASVIDPLSIFAVYEIPGGLNPDLIDVDALASVDDAIDAIVAQGDLLFTGGVVDSDDFLGFNFTKPSNALKTGAELSASSTAFATVIGGLTIIDNYTPITFQDVNGEPNQLTLIGSIGGRPFGAGNAELSDDVDFTDSVLFTVNARDVGIVPEASSLACWGILTLIGASIGIVRNRRN